jgi:autonomous glycyl radical cofactor GrcA
MPKGPEGEERPADVIGNAVRVMRIATGEEAENAAPADQAAELGRKGGAVRARSLTPEQRREVAEKGAASRWGKPK